MPKTPLGLVYRANCIRVLKSVWNKKSTRDYYIDSVKRTLKNIKPIVVIDDDDFSSECYLINKTLDTFDEHHDPILCRQIESIGKFMKTKYNILSSNKSQEDKQKFCTLNEQKNYWNKELSTKDEKAFNKFVKGLT